MPDPELDPIIANCPFCGSKDAALQEDETDEGDTVWFVECDECGAAGPPARVRDGEGSDDAADSWNKRV